MNVNTRPVLNSSRPTVNRNFLTDEQLQRRAEEIFEKSVTTVGEGTVISTGVNLASNKLHSGQAKLDESVNHGLVHGSLAGIMRALYEFGKDAVDTHLLGRVAENVGEYAPDLRDQNVRQAIVDAAKAEIERGDVTETKEGWTTPTLSTLGLYITK